MEAVDPKHGEKSLNNLQTLGALLRCLKYAVLLTAHCYPHQILARWYMVRKLSHRVHS